MSHFTNKVFILEVVFMAARVKYVQGGCATWKGLYSLDDKLYDYEWLLGGAEYKLEYLF
jgi:hypothetical protein